MTILFQTVTCEVKNLFPRDSQRKLLSPLGDVTHISGLKVINFDTRILRGEEKLVAILEHQQAPGVELYALESKLSLIDAPTQADIDAPASSQALPPVQAPVASSLEPGSQTETATLTLGPVQPPTGFASASLYQTTKQIKVGDDGFCRYVHHLLPKKGPRHWLVYSTS
jgi:hypothetical protein